LNVEHPTSNRRGRGRGFTAKAQRTQRDAKEEVLMNFEFWMMDDELKMCFARLSGFLLFLHPTSNIQHSTFKIAFGHAG